MGRKSHRNYSQSEATNQRYRCNPLWRTQLGSGKVSSSNSSSRTSRTSSSSGSSSSSSSDKTRPGKTTHLFPAILWRYPRDTLKWEKGTPRHQSPSSFQHNHISKFQTGKTQHNHPPEYWKQWVEAHVCRVQFAVPEAGNLQKWYPTSQPSHYKTGIQPHKIQEMLLLQKWNSGSVKMVNMLPS